MSIIGAAQQQDRNRTAAAAYTAIGDPDVVAIYDASSASYITSNAGTDVDVLNDISGNGRHAVASSATDKMQYDSANGWVKSAAVTGKSGLVTPSMTTGRMYVVMRCGDGTDTTWGAQQYLLTGNYGSFGKLRIGVSSTGVQFTDEVTSYNATSKKNGSGTSTAFQLPAPMSLFTFDVGASVKPVTQIHTIGCYTAGNGFSFVHPVKMIVFSSGAESTEQKIQGWMMHRYGLQSALVSGHPYRVTPP